MIFTAGYPYYILYGLILFSVYILFLLIIKNKNNIYGTYNLNFVSNITFLFKYLCQQFLPLFCLVNLFKNFRINGNNKR